MDQCNCREAEPLPLRAVQDITQSCLGRPVRLFLFFFHSCSFAATSAANCLALAVLGQLSPSQNRSGPSPTNAYAENVLCFLKNK